MQITVYSKPQCVWCARIKAEFRDRGWDFTDLTLDEDYTKDDLIKLIGPDKPRTVPQVVIDNQLIGTHDETMKWLKEYDEHRT